MPRRRFGRRWRRRWRALLLSPEMPPRSMPRAAPPGARSSGRGRRSRHWSAASARNVIFTSGGTEAANTVLTPSLRRAGDGGASLLLVGATEHACVLDGHRFATERVEKIPVDAAGGCRPFLACRANGAGRRRAGSGLAPGGEQRDRRDPAGRRGGGAGASTIGGLLHADAVQAAGKIPCDIRALGADVLTLSAHKLGGPKGVGAIVAGLGPRSRSATAWSAAAGRSGATGPAPRTSPGSSASASRPSLPAATSRRVVPPVRRPLFSTMPDAVLPPIATERGGVRRERSRGCRTALPSRSPASGPRRR